MTTFAQRTYDRRRMLGIAGAGAALTFAAGCSSSQSQDNSTKSGPTKITILMNSSQPVPKDDVIKQNLDKALNLNVSMTAVPADTYYSQLSASLAAGSAPDLFAVDRAHLSQFIEQGVVLDLTSYINSSLQSYADNVPEKSRQMARFDGKDYGITKRPTYHYDSYWIRNDWLGSVGAEAPTSIDDLTSVLDAFTHKDPNKNGKKDTYGLTGTNKGNQWSGLWPAFGSGGPGSFYLKDGAITNGYQDPDVVQALSYISSLWKSGVIDPNTQTNSGTDQEESRALGGHAGYFWDQWPRMTKPEFVKQYKKAQPNAEWAQVAPPSGPGGKGAVPFDKFQVPLMWAVPKSLGKETARLDALFKLINYVAEGPGLELVMYGVEGRDYNKKNGKVVPTDKLAEEGGHFWLYQLTGRDEAKYLSVKFAKQAQYIKFAENQNTFDVFDSIVVPPKGFNLSNAEAFAQQQYAGFMTGKTPLSQYNDFLTKLNGTFGYDTYVKSATTQLKKLEVGA